MQYFFSDTPIDRIIDYSNRSGPPISIIDSCHFILDILLKTSDKLLRIFNVDLWWYFLQMMTNFDVGIHAAPWLTRASFIIKPDTNFNTWMKMVSHNKVIDVQTGVSSRRKGQEQLFDCFFINYPRTARSSDCIDSYIQSHLDAILG